MATDPVKKLKRSEAIPFLNAGTVDAPAWVRAGRSTICSIEFGAQTSDVDFIMYDSTQTELDAYKPTIPLEQAIYEGDPCYDFLAEKVDALDVADAVIGFLFCFPGTPKKAWRVDEAQCVLTAEDFAGSPAAITYTINLNGERQTGTYTIADGVPTFTPAGATPAGA